MLVSSFIFIHVAEYNEFPQHDQVENGCLSKLELEENCEPRFQHRKRIYRPGWDQGVSLPQPKEQRKPSSLGSNGRYQPDNREDRNA